MTAVWLDFVHKTGVAQLSKNEYLWLTFPNVEIYLWNEDKCNCNCFLKKICLLSTTSFTHGQLSTSHHTLWISVRGNNQFRLKALGLKPNQVEITGMDFNLHNQVRIALLCSLICSSCWWFVHALKLIQCLFCGPGSI